MKKKNPLKLLIKLNPLTCVLNCRSVYGSQRVMSAVLVQKREKKGNTLPWDARCFWEVSLSFQPAASLPILVQGPLQLPWVSAPRAAHSEAIQLHIYIYIYIMPLANKLWPSPSITLSLIDASLSSVPGKSQFIFYSHNVVFLAPQHSNDVRDRLTFEYVNRKKCCSVVHTWSNLVVLPHWQDFRCEFPQMCV